MKCAVLGHLRKSPPCINNSSNVKYKDVLDTHHHAGASPSGPSPYFHTGYSMSSCDGTNIGFDRVSTIGFDASITAITLTMQQVSTTKCRDPANKNQFKMKITSTSVETATAKACLKYVGADNKREIIRLQTSLT